MGWMEGVYGLVYMEGGEGNRYGIGVWDMT